MANTPERSFTRNPPPTETDMKASPAYDQQKVFDPSHRIRKKLVIVGDGATGKTALLMVQALKPFPEVFRIH